MNIAYIRKLYEYDRWANARTLGTVEKLRDEQFRRDMSSSHRSIRDTLVHILSAERVWLARWKGGSLAAHLDPSKFSSVAALGAGWEEMERSMGIWLGSLTDELLQGVVSYATFGGQPQAQPLWQQMAHLANHSTYHRGQITTMLRQLGAEPVATDLIVFFRERPTASA
jgi:uncharacterized damage-inducible protein DinB